MMRFICLLIAALASAPGPAVAEPAQPTVVIYLIDTLRADRVGACGSSRGLTPHIDALGRGGVVFEQAYAPAPWTLPSVASIFSGLFATEHGLIEDKNQRAPALPLLGQMLKARGYSSATFAANAYARWMADVQSGYSHVQVTTADLPMVLGWVDRAKSPLHLYVHTLEPHNPFRAPDDWVRKFGVVSSAQRDQLNQAMQRYRLLTRVDYGAGQKRGATDNTAEQQAAMAQLSGLAPTLGVLYDSHVAWADQHVGEFIQAMKERGLWENCLFVLLSDHGEELGDHGGWQHDETLYEEIVRVPFLIRFPRDEFAGTRIASPVSLVDLLPTLAAHLGQKPEPKTGGINLLPLIRGGRAAPDAPRVVAVRINRKKYYRPSHELRGDMNIALRHGKWKGIWNVERGSFELYDLGRDPGEKSNVAETQKDVADAMVKFAKGWLRDQVRGTAAVSTRPHDREIESNLREMGYLGD